MYRQLGFVYMSTGKSETKLQLQGKSQRLAQGAPLSPRTRLAHPCGGSIPMISVDERRNGATAHNEYKADGRRCSLMKAVPRI